MRVLFLNYEYPPLGGGAANATAYILREFSRIPDLKVDLVTASIDQQYNLEKIGYNVSVHRLPIGKNAGNLHFQSQKDLLIYAWKAFWLGRKLIKQNNYNLTHSFFTVPCGFLSLIYYRLYKLPYIVSLRGADVPGYSERFTTIYGILTPIIKLIWKGAAAVVSNSQGLKELAQKAEPGQAIDIIFNGVDIENFRPDSGIKPEGKFIITTGASRLTARKGIRYLIAAMAKLSPRYPQLLLKIMGEGSEMQNLKSQAEELKLENKIIFLGRMAREETSPYYGEASVFVLPSLNEGMSNAMLEALATGLPILATDTGGTKELVKDGENGFIIKMKDAEDLAEKIAAILNNKELRQEMAKKSREIAKQMSWEKVAEQYYDLYKKVTAK